MQSVKKKILIIRFSSIGDVVLTSPIVRAIHNAGHEVHFLIKEKFVPVIESNPYITKIHYFKKKTDEVINTLKKEKFDFIIDLQNNRKSRAVCFFLGISNRAVSKLNARKLLTVWLKTTSVMPKVHIVDRYFNAARDMGIFKDSDGLDFFINENKLDFSKWKDVTTSYIVIVAGGSYATKKIPTDKLKEIFLHLKHKTIVLLGDINDAVEVKDTAAQFNNVINKCGELNLHESAYLIKNSEYVITSDTGLMHVAAAFKKKIFSLWGNTIPEFGMYPYLPMPGSKILEVKNLWCRPCSKLGFSKCPLGHFRCMKQIDISVIA